jgi:hypothetical protein
LTVEGIAIVALVMAIAGLPAFAVPSLRRYLKTEKM